MRRVARRFLFNAADFLLIRPVAFGVGLLGHLYARAIDDGDDWEVEW